MTTICFWIAVIVLLASCAGAYYVSVRAKKSRQMITPVNVLFAGVLFTSFALFLPAYWIDLDGDAVQWLKAPLLALYSAIRLFAFDSDYDMIRR